VQRLSLPQKHMVFSLKVAAAVVNLLRRPVVVGVRQQSKIAKESSSKSAIILILSLSLSEYSSLLFSDSYEFDDKISQFPPILSKPTEKSA